MSLEDNNLSSIYGGYTPAVVDFSVVRELLRDERKKRKMSLDDLAASSGLTRSAIHDVEVNNGGKPRFETVARIIEGLGITLSEFFTQIERQTEGDSTTSRQSDTTASSGSRPARAASTEHGGDPSVPPALSDDELPDVLRDIGHQFSVAAHRLEQRRLAQRDDAPARRRPPGRAADHLRRRR